MFKDYYSSNKSKRLSEIDEMFSLLSEDDSSKVEDSSKEVKLSDFYGKTIRLKTEGIKRLFKDPTKGRISPDPTNDFTVLDSKSKEDKDIIRTAKSEGDLETIIAYSPEGINGTFFDNDDGTIDVPPGFFSTFMLDGVKKLMDKEDLDFVDSITDTKSNSSKTYGKNTYKTIKKADAIRLIKILNKVNVQRKVGSTFTFYYLMDKETNKVYQILIDKSREATSPGRTFSTEGAYTGGNKYRANNRAQEPETLQVLGFFFDAVKMISDITKFKERNPDLERPSESKDFELIIEPFYDALHASNEFKNFKSNLLEDYKNFGYKDWGYVLSFAAGATLFLQKVADLKKPYIIHKSISDYRVAEKEKLGYSDEDRTKVSTVDAILSDIPAENLLALIKSPTTKLVNNNQRRCVEVKKDGSVVASYYQLSLKEDRNQKLGRGHKALDKKYAFANKAVDLFDSEVCVGDLINEGAITKLTDAAKNGLNILKQIGGDLIERLLRLSGRLKGWKNKLLAAIKESFLANVLNDAKVLFTIGLNEDSRKEDIQLIVSELLKKTNLKEIYESANLKIVKSIKDIETSKAGQYYKVVYNIPTASTVNGITPEVLYGMIFNFSYLETLKRLLIRNIGAQEMETYVDELVELYVDAIFGSTTLSLWKIFPINDKEDSDPFEYLGTREENKESRVSSILSHQVEDKMPLVIIDATNVKKGYHHMNMYTLSKIVNENGVFEPRYVKYNINFDHNSLVPLFMAQSEVPLPTIE